MYVGRCELVGVRWCTEPSRVRWRAVLLGVRWLVRVGWCTLVGASWLVYVGVQSPLEYVGVQCCLVRVGWCELVGVRWSVRVGWCTLVGGGRRAAADVGRAGVQAKNQTPTQ